MVYSSYPQLSSWFSKRSSEFDIRDPLPMKHLRSQVHLMQLLPSSQTIHWDKTSAYSKSLELPIGTWEEGWLSCCRWSQSSLFSITDFITLFQPISGWAQLSSPVFYLHSGSALQFRQSWYWHLNGEPLSVTVNAAFKYPSGYFQGNGTFSRSCIGLSLTHSANNLHYLRFGTVSICLALSPSSF